MPLTKLAWQKGTSVIFVCKNQFVKQHALESFPRYK